MAKTLTVDFILFHLASEPIIQPLNKKNHTKPQIFKASVSLPSGERGIVYSSCVTIDSSQNISLIIS